MNRAVPEEELDACVAEVAARIADYPGYAIAALKRVINAAEGLPDFLPETDGFVEAMLHERTMPLLQESLALGFAASLQAERDLPALLKKARMNVRERQSEKNIDIQRQRVDI